MKRFWIAIVLAIACIATAGAVAAPAEACPSNIVCAYTEAHLNGVESYTACVEGPHTLAAYKYSAKNNCPNRAITLIYAASDIPIICMNPGGERKTVEYNKVYVLANGSRC